MADIKQAAKWMQEGRRVKRPDERDGVALRCRTNGWLSRSAAGKNPALHVTDLLADDWEIAE